MNVHTMVHPTTGLRTLISDTFPATHKQASILSIMTFKQCLWSLTWCYWSAGCVAPEQEMQGKSIHGENQQQFHESMEVNTVTPDHPLGEGLTVRGSRERD